MSKLPKCLSTCIKVPTLPMLLPPVRYTNFPGSFLNQVEIWPFSRSYLRVSPYSISGWGNLIVLPSWVTIYGILLGPTALVLTFKSLNLASVSLIGMRVNLPLTSYSIL